MVQNNVILIILTFMGRNLENKKKLMQVQIMNSARLNSKNIVNIVGIFNDSSTMNNIFRGKHWDE